MPPRSRPPCLDPLEQSAVARDGFVQRLVVPFSDHVIEHLQHAARAGVERYLREREITRAGTRPLRDRGPLVDRPKATQREYGHINSLHLLARAELALVVEVGLIDDAFQVGFCSSSAKRPMILLILSPISLSPLTYGIGVRE